MPPRSSTSPSRGVPLLSTASLVVLASVPCSLHGQVSRSALTAEVHWFQPEMDGWSRSTPFVSDEGRGTGSLGARVGAEMRLRGPLYARVEAGYWRRHTSHRDVATGMGLGEEALSVRLLPVGVTLLADILSHGETKAYMGAGGSLVWLRKAYTFTQSSETMAAAEEVDHGRDLTAHALFGVERRLSPHYALAVEGRYVLGSYRQELILDDGSTREESIGLRGPAAALVFRYLPAR